MHFIHVYFTTHPSATVEVKVAKNINKADERVLKWNPSLISFQYCGNRRLGSGFGIGHCF